MQCGLLTVKSTKRHRRAFQDFGRPGDRSFITYDPDKELHFSLSFSKRAELSICLGICRNGKPRAWTDPIPSAAVPGKSRERPDPETCMNSTVQ